MSKVTMAGLGYRMAMLLDASMHLFEAETKREAAREAGKTIRCVTAREREKVARELLKEAETIFGYEP